MSENLTEDKELLSAIKDLPRSVPPQRNLWPGIAARLEERLGRPVGFAGMPGWRRYGVAATVALAFLTGLMFGRQMSGPAMPPATEAHGDLALLVALEASEREYQAAFREFIPLGDARPVLEAQAVQNIEKSWYDLQQAETALLAALQEYPENIYLKHKIMDLRAQQLGFMKQLAMLDHFSRRNT